MSDLQIRLPDGRTLDVSPGTTVLDVASSIGQGLARASLAGRLDGRLLDLRTPIHESGALEIITVKDADGGQVIRHSAEHVMADAVKRLFPDVQIDVGRSDHSEKFQYDFLVERPFSPEDLEKITACMKSILKEKAEFQREVVTREEAREIFEAQGEKLKLSRLDDIPEGEEVTLFRHGEFVDLCRGPHVRRADQIGAFTLLETAGAYWRGDESNPMLQRIYGMAFANKKEMAAHLERLEEAKRRDHRRVGVDLDLYRIDSEISPGSPFYMPKGTILYNGLCDYIRSLYPKYGFKEVITPLVYRTELYKISGHYDLFNEDMFVLPGADEGEELAVKPMNCPGHCRLYEMTKYSYRDLPIRFAEFSRLHRNERSGTLNGLTRVRAMAQDDAHIYCERDQVDAEVDRFFEMVEEVYRDLGLSGVQVHVSTRGEKFKGTPEDWDVAEQSLIRAVERAGFQCGIKPGEAAFYGPKVECDFQDVLGRSWTLATIQIDLWMPGNFGLRYVGRDGQEHQPAMLHRAVLGSLERFMAIYIEHTLGDFPLWLAPVQVAVLPIAERHAEYAVKVQAALSERGLRAQADTRGETLGLKIREAEIQKIPIMLVTGDQEVTNGTVTPRRRDGSKGPSESMTVDAFIEELVDRVERRA